MDSSEIFYTKFAQSYEDYASTKDAYLSSVNKFIIRESKKTVQVIDIGSGNGVRSKKIADELEASELVLFDNSSGMVALSKNIPHALVIFGDISDENFKLEKTFDVVMCLWNVFGHIPTTEERSIALKNIKKLLAPGGLIFIDVNNRYNVSQYGFNNVCRNIFKDIFSQDSERGNFELTIQAKEGDFKTQVHIFSPQEMNKLIDSAGLKIVKRQFINYETGKACKSVFCGQLLYKISR